MERAIMPVLYADFCDALGQDEDFFQADTGITAACGMDANFIPERGNACTICGVMKTEV